MTAAAGFPPEHEKAHRNAHKANIAVPGIQPLDTRIRNAPPAPAAETEPECEGDGDAAGKRQCKSQLADLVGGDLGHRHEHQRGKAK